MSVNVLAVCHRAGQGSSRDFRLVETIFLYLLIFHHQNQLGWEKIIDNYLAITLTLSALVQSKMVG
jgi:hypothetical protein